MFDIHEIIAACFMSDGIAFLPLVIGCISSLAFGVVGSFITARRISYIATSIGHSVLVGIGLAGVLSQKLGWEWCTPFVGALASAIPAALIIGIVTLKARHRADAVISSVMVIGMASGLLLLNMTDGYFSPESVLFGNILYVGKSDVISVAIGTFIVLSFAIIFYNKLLAVCFDEVFARLRGINADLYFLMLLIFIAITVVLMMQIVGIIMVIAMLTLPAVTASLFGKKLWHNMILASAISICCVIGGIVISYPLELASGPVIVLMAGLIYLIMRIIRLLFPQKQPNQITETADSAT